MVPTVGPMCISMTVATNTTTNKAAHTYFGYAALTMLNALRASGWYTPTRHRIQHHTDALMQTCDLDVVDADFYARLAQDGSYDVRNLSLTVG